MQHPETDDGGLDDESIIFSDPLDMWDVIMNEWR